MTVNFGREKELLRNLRFMAGLMQLKPSEYVKRLVERDVQEKIAEINKGMKYEGPRVISNL